MLKSVSGVTGWSVAGAMWVAAVQRIGPAKASIVASTSALFAVPLTVVFLRERATRWTLIGTLLTVLAVILVI